MKLEEDRREAIIKGLQSLYLTEFEEELSRFRAERLLDHLAVALAPHVYNQAIQDARKFMQERLDDLDVEIHLPEEY